MSGARSLIASERKNVRAGAEPMLLSALSSSPKGDHEHMGLADSFDPHSARLIGDVEQAFRVIELRRFVDEETGVEMEGHNANSPGLETSERVIRALIQINSSCPQFSRGSAPLFAPSHGAEDGQQASAPNFTTTALE